MRAVLDVVESGPPFEQQYRRILSVRTALTLAISHAKGQWKSVEEFNDWTSHADVMKLFDDAIHGVER
jgi:hypothetical protein